MKIILEENQSIERTGFRENFSILDHIQVVSELIERTNDYEKAFDIVSHNAVFRSLRTRGELEPYVGLLIAIYVCIRTPLLRLNFLQIQIVLALEMGKKQGEFIFLKLFDAISETCNGTQKE